MSMGPNSDWIGSLRQERAASKRKWGTALILSICLGLFGADRFYVGRVGLGIIKLLTVGGFFIWWIFDIVLLLQGRMKDELGRELRRI